jgi:uncharacterized protein
MFRQISEDLINWKNSKRRKPLLLQGARQVGKTWIVEDFGKSHYKNFIKLNFEFETNVHNIFESSLDPNEIIQRLSLFKEQKITANDTLIFFDEIQTCPKAITSLKYFQEKAPQFHIIAAGSLLGVSVVNNQNSFPVGKVNFLHLYPMSFYEFLIAIGKPMLADFIKEKPTKIDKAIHEQIMELLKIFIYVGGMPEVVDSYVTNADIEEVKEIQNEILQSYERDFTKYADPNQAIKTKEIWNSIPYQLGKENKKFKYSEVHDKARASTYELTFEWLKAAGLIYKVNQIRTAKLPLKGYEDSSKFKVYPLDSGLLSATLQVSSTLILNGSELFSIYQGALIESFICSEIVKWFRTIPHYWVSNSEAEVDFVFQLEDVIYPIEVKSGMDRNTKGLRSYQQISNSKTIFRASPRKYSESEDGFINFGLYGIMGLRNMM